LKYFFGFREVVRNITIVSTLSLYPSADNNLVLFCFAPPIATTMSASLLARIVFPAVKLAPIDWVAIRELQYQMNADKELRTNPAVKATISKFVNDWVAHQEYLDYIHDNPESTLTIQEYINQIFINNDYYEMDYFDGTSMNTVVQIYKSIN
jgi:hypothetical protein